jgi:hypothetical protein
MSQISKSREKLQVMQKEAQGAWAGAHSFQEGSVKRYEAMRFAHGLLDAQGTEALVGSIDTEIDQLPASAEKEQLKKDWQSQKDQLNALHQQYGKVFKPLKEPTTRKNTVERSETEIHAANTEEYQKNIARCDTLLNQAGTYLTEARNLAADARVRSETIKQSLAANPNTETRRQLMKELHECADMFEEASKKAQKARTAYEGGLSIISNKLPHGRDDLSEKLQGIFLDLTGKMQRSDPESYKNAANEIRGTSYNK